MRVHLCCHGLFRCFDHKTRRINEFVTVLQHIFGLLFNWVTFKMSGVDRTFNSTLVDVYQVWIVFIMTQFTACFRPVPVSCTCVECKQKPIVTYIVAGYSGCWGEGASILWSKSHQTFIPFQCDYMTVVHADVVRKRVPGFRSDFVEAVSTLWSLWPYCIIRLFFFFVLCRKKPCVSLLECWNKIYY